MARMRFRLRVLNYNVTSNHIDLLRLFTMFIVNSLLKVFATNIEEEGSER